MSIGTRIKELRNLLKLKQSEFADKIGISAGALSEIEKGKRNPPFEAFVSICGIAQQNAFCLEYLIHGNKKTSFDYTEYKEMINKYDALENNYKIMLTERLNTLYELTQKENMHKNIKQNIKHITDSEQHNIKYIPYFGKVAGGAPIEMINLYDFDQKTIPVPQECKADFALEITGDSMDPLYPDGSIVYVKSQETLEQGQIGIFRLSGEATCKKYNLNDKWQPILISINKKYDPIIIDDTIEDFKIIGRVISGTSDFSSSQR